MSEIDFALERDADGIFDLVIEDGDFKTVDGFDTAINMSIFCERRADASEQPVNFLRRGWWGNLLADIEGFEIGSKLWLLYQARIVQNTLNLAISYLQDGLQWMVTDGLLENVLVIGEIRDFKRIIVTISLIRSNNVVDSRSFELWNNTFKEVA